MSTIPRWLSHLRLDQYTDEDWALVSFDDLQADIKCAAIDEQCRTKANSTQIHSIMLEAKRMIDWVEQRCDIDLYHVTR